MNNAGTGNNVTSATYIFNANKTGTFTFICQINDPTGLFSGTVTSPEVVLLVSPIVGGGAPIASPKTGLGNLELTVILIAAVATIVIAGSVIIVKKRKKP